MTSEKYDALWSEDWGALQEQGPVHRHIREDLVAVVGSLGVGAVLDVGCGGGDNLAALAAIDGLDLAGADVSDTALARARHRVDGSFHQLDVERAALSERFDLVMAVQVLEHLVDDIAALRNMAAMSSRYVFISTMQGRMRPSEVDIGHVRNYSKVELATKLETAGLNVVWTRGWGFPFYTPLVRSLVEHLPGGPPRGEITGPSRRAAQLLYHLYRWNIPGKGDVLSMLAEHSPR